MISTAFKLRWGGFFRKLVNGSSKRRNEQLTRANNVRERSIRILQNRYGYTKDQATSELDKHYSKTWLG